MKKWLFLIIICLGLSNNIYADNNTAPELTKEQKKAIEKRNREIQDSIYHATAAEAMAKGFYVLMADRIMIKGRAFMNPTPNTNFILIQGDNAIIQLAANNGRTGLNGLGGITVEGKINGLKGGIPDKKGKITYNFGVSGPAISAQVHITLYGEDNQATAIVSPNFWSGNLTVYGRIVPYEEVDYEKAIKGTSFP